MLGIIGPAPHSHTARMALLSHSQKGLHLMPFWPFRRSHSQSQPPANMTPSIRSEVAEALDEFLGATTWPETFAVLEERQDILLSNAARTALRALITAYFARPDQEAGIA